jgi:sugar phosphate isomerase/epimerase
MDRREFLKTSGFGVLAAGVAGFARRSAGQEAAAAAPAVLRLCSQEGRIPGKDLREKVLKLESWGGVGMEFGGAPGDRISQIKEAIKGTGVKVSALCWGSRNGDLVSTDAQKRREGIVALQKALDVAGELESPGVIFVPCFHKQSELTPAQLDPVLLEILPELAEHAKARGTRVLLEPLNKGETFYLNRLEQAAVFCEKVNSPGLAMMGDFYHMGKEESDDRAAFVRAGKWLHHVHLASRVRVLPGQDDRSFVEGFKGLKQIGYQDFCSLECGVKKDTDPEVEIPKSFRFLEEQWRLAVG